MKIAFLFPYPVGTAPSQRFRFEQYYASLDKAGIQYSQYSFLDQKTWDVLYKPGHSLKKVLGIVKGFLRRMVLMFQLFHYDFVFIHREVTPIGPPIFEWIIAKVLRKKIIYDFDDAIWIPNTSSNNSIVAGIKWHGKVTSICKWAYKVSCGNEYLANYAKQFNENVIINPTTIDTVNLHNLISNHEVTKPVIGWTGSHSTMVYINEILPVINKLNHKYDFDFVVISNKEPDFKMPNLKFIPWNKETEIEDLAKLNIGIMPLTEDLWAKGKCGFKALQYMALGIPALVSPIGVNTTIVNNDVNGFICDTENDWEESLVVLLQNADKRKQLGINARRFIEDNFSIISNENNFLSLFAK
jgi:glycosyltransferase involved in cell wall biosynthesis